MVERSAAGLPDKATSAVADARSICAWLRGQGAPTAGLWGFSLGAWLAGIVARSDSQLGFAVLTTPIASIERALSELPFCESARRFYSLPK